MKFFTLLLACLISLNLVSAQEFYNVDLLANVDYTDGNTENGNDVWGYVDDNGIEYAIAGSTAATYIYSLEDPSEPVLRARIEGATSTWRDIKDHNEYLYVVADVGTDGLLVIDMSAAPDTITWDFYKPDVEVANSVTPLERCHNLYITNEGYCILTGCNIYSGTPLFFDLTVNPEEPPFIGAPRRTYAHDVYAENGILYSSDIYLGQVTTHDYTDPTNIFELGSAVTSTTFTHNAWPTSDDATVFTTDERTAAFVDAYDVSDPTDLRFLDKFRPDDTWDEGSIPHNTHVLGDYLATSWYRDGVILTDVSRPHNMVEVGRYDTYPLGGGTGFDGNWGAYPYLPSGLLLATDIQTGLYVLQPNYEKGCYFEGVVLDSITRQPVAGVTVDFSGLAAQSTTSDISGDFATGIYEEGFYPVTFSKEGYQSKQVVARMNRGQLDYQEVELVSLDLSNISVQVVDESGLQVPGAESSVQLRSSANGVLTVDVLAGAWGYVTNKLSGVQVDPSQAVTLTIVLSEGFYDDFVFDFDWNVEAGAATGNFERAVPLGTFSGNTPAQLGEDVPFDFGGEAYVTGNAGTGAGDDDVDNGTTTLTSPPMNLIGKDNSFIEFYYYFYNEGGNSQPDDALEVSLSNGTETISLLTVEETVTGGWTKFKSEALGSLITLTDEMSISFTTSDLANSGHLVEAMIDAFSVSTIERPDVTFSPSSGCAPLGVEALAIGDPNYTYTWRFFGADNETATGDEPFVNYSTAGTYDVVLTVDNGSAGVATFNFSNVVEVLPQTVASFRTEVFGDTVAFFNTSIGGSSAMWDFGDGTTSDELFTQHVYGATGDYTVTLTASGPCGTETVTQVVSVISTGTLDFFAETGISVLGNPVDQRLALRNDSEQNAQLQLRNVLGQTLMEMSVPALGDLQVDVSRVPVGSYFLADAKTGASVQILIVR